MKTILFLSFFLFSNLASAYCTKSYVCNGGNCGYIDVCDSTLDLPSTNIQPIQPLPSIELEPLPSLELPPIGTTQCEYMQVNGNWQNVCY